MIRTFAALKWRLVVNGIRQNSQRWIVIVGSVLLFGGAILYALSSAVRARTSTSPVVVRTTGVGTYVLVFALWVFMPLLVGVDETVDPNKLALLPLTRRELRTGLITASMIGVGPAAAAIVLIGLLFGFAPLNAGAVLVFLAVVIGFALGLSASRALATLLAQAQRSRRGRDISVAIAAGVGVTLWVGIQLLPRLKADTATRLLDWLRFTPPGLAGQAIVDAANGHDAVAIAGLAGAIAWVALCTWVWIAGIGHLLVDTGASTRREDTRALTKEDRTRWTRGSETIASARKELLYLVRSPSRRTVAIIATVFGAGITAIQVFNAHRTIPAGAVLIAPAAAVFGLNVCNNVFGYDSPSLWIEVIAGGPRRAQFVGRDISWFPAIVLPSVPSALLIASVSHGWKYVPIAIGLAIAIAGVPLGVGAVVSALVPFPVPDTGNPFANRYANTGRGCIVGLISIGALLTDIVLLLPAIIAVVLANEHSMAALAIILVPIALWSIGIWTAGVSLGVRRVRGREPELLAALSPRK
jgi:ABC-2 type transport system permease protein